VKRWSEKWPWQQFEVRPRRQDDTGQVFDPHGTLLGHYDSGGTVYDASGLRLLVAPVQTQGHRSFTRVEMPIWDAEQRFLGVARVAKHRIGPRAKKVTLAIVDESGNFLIGLEPRDKLGLHLAVTSPAGDLAGANVEETKAGMFQKSRVYRVSLYQSPQDDLYPVMLAVLVRFDAVLTKVLLVSSADRRDSDSSRMDSDF
jgi:hypothetical protein